MKVLVVDDSVVFRSQITAALNSVPGIEVVGAAPNGRLALQRLAQTPADLITLDMEMPEMDGLQTLAALKAQNSTVNVIVFSSQTIRGAEKALEALRMGAKDVVAKPAGDDLNFEKALDAIKANLIPKVIQFIDQRLRTYLPSSPTTPSAQPFSQQSLNQQPQNRSNEIDPKQFSKSSLRAMSPQALLIASSTGGPTALETIFAKVKGPFTIPILIAQHMPPVFTQILARRLGDLTGVSSREAMHGDVLVKNQIYIAPGDFHLRVEQAGVQTILTLAQDQHRNSIRPSADYLFETAAVAFGSKCVGVVLTGMGEDGKEGAIAVKKAGGGILIQNKESCIVFGMPGAVYDSGAYDEIGDLSYITDQLNFLLKR